VVEIIPNLPVAWDDSQVLLLPDSDGDLDIYLFNSGHDRVYEDQLAP
jgi:hypothetical protein